MAVSVNKLFFWFLIWLSLGWPIGYPAIRYPLYLFIPFMLAFFTHRLKTSASVIRLFYYIFSLLFCYALIWGNLSVVYFLLISVYVLFGVLAFDILDIDETYEGLLPNSIISFAFVTFLSLFLFQNPLIGKMSGFYPEPSALGFTLGPPLGLLSFTPGYKRLGCALALLLAMLSPSASFILGFLSPLLVVGLTAAIKKPYASLVITVFICIIPVLLVFGLAFESFEASIKPGSAIVYYHKLQYAASIIFDKSNYFGVGPFGWLLNGGETPVNPTDLTTYNQRDLASLTAYGFATFGIVYPIIIYLCCDKFLKAVQGFSNSMYLKTQVSILVVSYLIVFSLRWTGLTAGPLIGFLILSGISSKVAPPPQQVLPDFYRPK